MAKQYQKNPVFDEPVKQQAKSEASTAKRCGRYLNLTFAGEKCRLRRIEFRYDSKWDFKFREVGDQKMPLVWPKNATAISLCFLGYLDWHLSKKPTKYSFGSEPSLQFLARRLSGAIFQNKHQIHDLFFGENPESKEGEACVTHRIFPKARGNNKSGRDKEDAVLLTIDDQFLPTDCLNIFWDKTGSGNYQPVTSQPDLLELENAIRKIHGIKKKPAAASGIRETARPANSKAAKKYAAAIRSRYQRVPLEILDPTGAFYQEMSLVNIYVPQNICEAKKFLPAALEYSRPDVEDITTPSRQESLPVLDVIDGNENRIVILGSLGAGKSSLIQFLALRWAGRAEKKSNPLKFPFVIELRTFAEARQKDPAVRDFLDFLGHSPGAFWHFSKEELATRLADGNAAIYLDGLDEILDSALQDEVVSSVVRIASEYPETQIIVTSRLIGYRENGLRRAGFKHYNLFELSEQQIATFIERWQREFHRNEKSPAAKLGAENFKRTLSESRSLTELAANPLLLTIMLILGRNEDLPKSRAALFSQCSNMLLERWKVDAALRADPDLAQDAAALGIREKKAILRSIVGKIMDSSTPLNNRISAADLEACITKSIDGIVSARPLSVARAIVKQLRVHNGILRLSATDEYAFVHRGFFEFFCADNLRQKFFPNNYFDQFGFASLILSKQSYHSGWNVILQFLCGILEPTEAESVLRFLLSKEMHRYLHQPEKGFLLAECLEEIGNHEHLSKNILNSIKGILVEISQRSEINKKPFRPRPEISWQMQRDMYDDYSDNVDEGNQAVYTSAGRAIELLGRIFIEDPKIVELLKSFALADSIYFGSNQRLSVMAIAEGLKSNPSIQEWMRNVAAQSKNPNLRKAALSAVSLKLPDSDTFDFLTKRFELDADNEVKIVIIREAALLSQKLPKINLFDFLTARLESNPHDKVKAVIIGELALRCQNQKVVKWLKELVCTASSFQVRAAAMGGLARNFISDRKVLAWLKRIVCLRQEEDLHGLAVDEICENVGAVPELFDWLIKLVKNAKLSEEIRSAAVSQLSEYWFAKEDVQLLLDQLFRKDKHDSVREAAFHGLGERWLSDPKNLKLLKSLAQSDPNQSLRNGAMMALAEYWKDDPEYSRVLEAKAKLDLAIATKQMKEQSDYTYKMIMRKNKK